MFKKETVSIVCSSSSTCLGCGKPRSSPGLAFAPVAGRALAHGTVTQSGTALCFCSLLLPNPFSALWSAPILRLPSSPKREDFSIWQLGIRLLAWFPSFTPLDLTKQNSCLPGPYALFQGEFTIEIINGTDINSLIRKLVCLKGCHPYSPDCRRFPVSLQSVSRQKLEPKWLEEAEPPASTRRSRCLNLAAPHWKPRLYFKIIVLCKAPSLGYIFTRKPVRSK